MIPVSKSVVVYNSLRLKPSETPGDRNAARLHLGVEDNRCLITWVGNFGWNKNPVFLLRAAACMRKLHDAFFILAGKGVLEREMRDVITRHGLENYCRLIPFQQDVRTLMCASDVLALTSRHESFGLVLIEAGAYGRPVVATRTQGPTEVIADGLTGFLVSLENESDLAAKLDLLVSDPDLRNKMGQAGSHRVSELFSAEKNTARIETVFREVLGITSGLQISG